MLPTCKDTRELHMCTYVVSIIQSGASHFDPGCHVTHFCSDPHWDTRRRSFFAPQASWEWTPCLTRLLHKNRLLPREQVAWIPQCSRGVSWPEFPKTWQSRQSRLILSFLVRIRSFLSKKADMFFSYELVWLNSYVKRLQPRTVA